MKNLNFKPNFFIVGAPKSGTTSLHYYLSQHPEVLMSKKKEPCFLAPDFESPVYPQTEEEYLKCWGEYLGEPFIGESTSTYLYSKLSAESIFNYAPNAKIIAMLRNPVELVPSLHAQRLKEGDETIKNLEEAMNAEHYRRINQKIPVGFKYPKEYLLYREYGKYSKQLERFFSFFDKKNIHIIIFEDFKHDVQNEYIKVCKFLGISENFTVDFSIQNQGEIPRFLLMHRLFIRITPFIVNTGKRLSNITNEKFIRFCQRLYNIPLNYNMKKGKEPIPNKVRRNLNTFYYTEIKKLEKLLGRDLSFWLKE